MMKMRTILLAMALIPLVGCGGLDPGSGGAGGMDGAPMLKARETAALAQLKRFSTAQNLHHVESGRFARDLEELLDSGGGILKRELVAASGPTGRPLNEYLYSALITRTSGQAGLVAYPADGGGRVLLILIDEAYDDGASEASPVGTDSSRIYWAEASNIRTPFTRWPSQATLAKSWTSISRRSPESGLREAEQMSNDLRENQTPQ